MDGSFALSFAGLALTVITSAVGVAAWLSAKFARLENEVKHAVVRINTLEKKQSRPAPVMARRKK